MDAPLPQNKPAQTAGTGYTNLNQYIGANQNNQLGSAVSGGIQQAGQAATGAVNAAGQQFQQGVGTEQQRLASQGENVSNALGNLGNIQASDISNTQSALSGQGQGPTGLANANRLQEQAQQAQGQGQATGTDVGRFGLLQGYVGKGQQYGLGQQTLDAAILGQTGQPQLTQARAATQGLGAKTNQAIQAAQAQGVGLQNQAQQLAAQTKGQLGGAVTSYDQQMAQKLAADQATTNAAIQQLSNPSNAAVNLTPAQLQQLSSASGGVLNSGTNLYNVNLAPYLSANNTYANNQAVQSTGDFAKAQALSQLAGNYLGGTDQGALLQSYVGSPQSVGQYAANNPFTVSSQSGLSDALKSAESAYNWNLNDLTRNMGQLNQTKFNDLVSGNAADQAVMEDRLQGYGTQLKALPGQFDINRILGSS